MGWTQWQRLRRFGSRGRCSASEQGRIGHGRAHHASAAEKDRMAGEQDHEEDHEKNHATKASHGAVHAEKHDEMFGSVGTN